MLTKMDNSILSAGLDNVLPSKSNIISLSKIKMTDSWSVAERRLSALLEVQHPS